MADATPQVSIILPTYNRSHLLPRAVDAILNQTFSEFELIIVNDGSTDDTQDYLNSIKDDRVVVISKLNGGQASALNEGLNRTQGKYVCFCDDDDLYLPDRLEKAVSYLDSHQNIDVAYSEFWVETKDGKRFRHTYKEVEDHFFEWLFSKSFLYPNAVTLRRSAIGKTRFDEKIKIGNDYDFFLRLAAKGCKFAPIHSPSVIYYQHDQAMTANFEQMKDIVDLLNKNFAELNDQIDEEWVPAVESSIAFRTGQYHFWLKESTTARNYFLKAISIQSTNLRPYAFLPFTFLPMGVFDFFISIYQMITGRYYSKDCA